METLRHLFSYCIKIAFAFFFFACVWWLISLLFPQFSFSNVIPMFTSGTSTSSDWLPSPKAYGGLLGKAATPDDTTNVYVHGAPHTSTAPFNGYGLGSSGYAYSTYVYERYDAKGNKVLTTGTGDSTADSEEELLRKSQDTRTGFLTKKNLLIRNLSIYEGGHVYNGLSFTGEAKSILFKNGVFPIIVVDASGRVVGVSQARALTTWSTAGWTRFDTKITYLLPNNVPCTMVFEEGKEQYSYTVNTKQPLRVGIPVRCN